MKVRVLSRQKVHQNNYFLGFYYQLERFDRQGPIRREENLRLQFWGDFSCF